jgi:hypothetical protein
MITFLGALRHERSDEYFFYPRVVDNFSFDVIGPSQSVNSVQSEGKNPTEQLRQESPSPKNLIKSTPSIYKIPLVQALLS